MAAESTALATRSRTRLQAAAFLVIGILIFSLQDVILKWMSGSYPLTEAMAIRSSGAIIILLVSVHLREGLRHLWSRRIGLLVLRGIILLVAYGSYYMALPAMPLAEVVALFFMAPIFITVLAYPVLGERARLMHWMAVLVGFLGVIVTYWPELTGAPSGSAAAPTFDWALLLPILSTLAYALAQLMARKLRANSASVQGLYQNAMYLVGALGLTAVFALGNFTHPGQHPSIAFLVRDWIYGNPTDLLLLAACAPISAAGTVFLSQAYRMAEANFVASFEYSGLIWGASWGFFIWHEVPTLYMLAGAALIIAAGLFMLFVGRRQEP